MYPFFVWLLQRSFHLINNKLTNDDCGDFILCFLISLGLGNAKNLHSPQWIGNFFIQRLQTFVISVTFVVFLKTFKNFFNVFTPMVLFTRNRVLTENEQN